MLGNSSRSSHPASPPKTCMYVSLPQTRPDSRTRHGRARRRKRRSAEITLPPPSLLTLGYESGGGGVIPTTPLLLTDRGFRWARHSSPVRSSDVRPSNQPCCSAPLDMFRSDWYRSGARLPPVNNRASGLDGFKVMSGTGGRCLTSVSMDGLSCVARMCCCEGLWQMKIEPGRIELLVSIQGKEKERNCRIGC